MSTFFWFLILGISLLLALIAIGLIVLYYKMTNKYKNSLVARIFLANGTLDTHRFFKMPIDDKILIKETDKQGEERPFEYDIKEECIVKGSWGRYIDYDYHIPEPINPKNRHKGLETYLSEIKETFKLVAGFLDTDLHVKLLRNSKFEAMVKALLIILIIVCSIGAVTSSITMVKSFIAKPQSDTCTLKLDNQTWSTIYIASHNPSPSMSTTKTTGGK